MENENHTLNLIKTKEWMVLLALVLMAAGVVLWLFLGTLVITSEATGVTLDYAGCPAVVFAVSSEDKGSITAEETRASVLLDGYDAESYGYLTGTIVWISETTVDQNQAIAEFGAECVAALIPEDTGRCYFAMIRLDTNEAGEPLFTGGQTLDFKTNRYGDVTVILSEKHPVEIIFG